MLQAAYGAGTSEVVHQVIDSQVDQLLGSQSIQQYNEDFISNHGSTSLRHTAAAARMLLLLQPQEKEHAVKLLVDSQAVSEQPGKPSATACCKCLVVCKVLLCTPVSKIGFTCSQFHLKRTMLSFASWHVMSDATVCA